MDTKYVKHTHTQWSIAAAAKLLQSCLTLCDPLDSNPPGSAVPGILQTRILEWAAISFSNAWKWKVKVKSLSCIWLFVTPWTAAYQAPPSMGFSRQEYWSGVRNGILLNHKKNFPGGTDCKEFACSAREPGLIPESGRSPGNGMATNSCILAWKIPWTEKSGGLQTMGLQTVRYDWATNTFTFIKRMKICHLQQYGWTDRVLC